MDPNNINRPPPSAPPSGMPQPSGVYPRMPQEPPQQAEIGQTAQQPGVGGSQSDTFVNGDPSPLHLNYDPPSEGDEGPQKSRISAPERAVTGVVAGMLSLTTIGLTFAALQRPYELFKNPSGPLAVGIIITLANIMALAWVLCVTAPRTTAFGALLPLGFSALGGMMIVIFFAAAQSNKIFENVDINLTAVMTCAGVFGGIALGATVEYLAFARNEHE